MGLEFNFDDLEKGLEEFAKRAEQIIDDLCVASAKDLEAYAKANKPWTNRTGEAQRRLSGTSKRTDDYTWTLTLSHGVDYGIWLEIAHEERYAIIQPTIRVKSPKIMKNFNHAIDKLSSKL